MVASDGRHGKAGRVEERNATSAAVANMVMLRFTQAFNATYKDD